MNATFTQSVLIIAVCAVFTFMTRFIPFAVFGRNKIPSSVDYLGKILPPAIIATLVVYCLRSMSFSQISGFVPAIISVAVICVLHLVKRNTLLSVGVGTVLYMVLIRIM